MVLAAARFGPIAGLELGKEDGEEEVSQDPTQYQADTEIPVVGHEDHHQNLTDIIGEAVQDGPDHILPDRKLTMSITTWAKTRSAYLL